MWAAKTDTVQKAGVYSHMHVAKLAGTPVSLACANALIASVSLVTCMVSDANISQVFYQSLVCLTAPNWPRRVDKTR